MCPTVKRPQIAPQVQCQPWEKSLKGKCVCKMPFECRYSSLSVLNLFLWAECFLFFLLNLTTYSLFPSSSLEVCTTAARTNKPILLTVCRMHALQCMGKKHLIAEDSVCKWPERNTTGCTDCRLWERCDGGDNKMCKDSRFTDFYINCFVFFWGGGV